MNEARISKIKLNMVSAAATLDFHIFCRSTFDHVLTLFIGNVKIYLTSVKT